MKTLSAIILYWVAILILLIYGGVIIWNLVLWPPCTPRGNACAIEPWTAAGLAGSVLAIAATVLAVLGAVSVAAWWTSLNDIVTNRVNKLYDKQEKRIQQQVTKLLTAQKKEADDQLIELQVRIGETRTDLEKLSLLAHHVEENMTDGLLAVGKISELEEWAQKEVEKKESPTIPIKMAASYLKTFKDEIYSAKLQHALDRNTPARESNKIRTDLDKLLHDIHELDNLSDVDNIINQVTQTIEGIQGEVINWIHADLNQHYIVSKTLDDWEGVNRWLDTADEYLLAPIGDRTELQLNANDPIVQQIQEKLKGNADDAEILRLRKEVEQHREWIDKLKEEHSSVKDRYMDLLLQTTNSINTIKDERERLNLDNKP